MKKSILLFALIVGIFSAAWTQDSEIRIRPMVSTTVVDSIVVTEDSDTLTSTTAPFTDITTGMTVYGHGIPFGTTVDSVYSGKDTLILSEYATRTSASDSLNFSKLSATAYSSGDWLGLPFLVLAATGSGNIATLNSVLIADSSDQAAATDLVLFSAVSDSAGLDNHPVAMTGKDFNTVLGIVSLTTVTDYGVMRSLTKDGINLSLPMGAAIYGRLISRGTPTLTSTTAYYIRLRFLP